MHIQKHDFYKFSSEYRKNFIVIRYGDLPDIPYLIRDLFKSINTILSATNFKKYVDTDKDALIKDVFMYFTIVLELKKNLVYICDLFWETYLKMEDQSAEHILELCMQGEYEYNVITLENFKYLLDQWIGILEYKPNFALLYQDENDWYDILPFQTENQMKQFVQDHQQ